MCSVSKPWFFILLLFLYSVQKRIDMQKNESERAGKAFCYCFSFLSILNLHINLNFTYALAFWIWYYMAKCLCSQNFEFLIINFLVVLHAKANKCAKKKNTMRTSVLAKPSILVVIFSAFQIYLLFELCTRAFWI